MIALDGLQVSQTARNQLLLALIDHSEDMLC
jgi:hypothetical protein